MAITRLMLGFVFLWAFFDKLMGLGMATPAERAWLAGGSPTGGFLRGVDGPFAGLFNAMAGAAWADWLFMAGLLGIGLGLVLGIALRVTAVAGVALMAMMWLAVLPLDNNPWVDDHLVYAGFMAVIGLTAAQQRWTLQAWWRRLPLVKGRAWLQ